MGGRRVTLPGESDVHRVYNVMPQPRRPVGSDQLRGVRYVEVGGIGFYEFKTRAPMGLSYVLADYLDETLRLAREDAGQ
jgi:hypothetical protein